MTQENKNTLDLLEKRYFKRDKTTGSLIEHSWSDIAKRVSESIAQAEENIDIYSKLFYDMINSMEFIPSTPCLVNANKDKTGQLSSCFIIDMKDNIESIYNANSELAKIFQKNGGAGFDISVLRPEGTSVETSKGYSCGVVGFMEIFDKTADVVTRNNTRKGAIKVDLAVWHPDIYKFIHCKDDITKLNNMNISVSITDEFMKAVERDSYWDLIFPDYSTCKDVYNREWDGDIDEWLLNGYPVKKYKTVKARKLYSDIMYHAWLTGEPGASFRCTIKDSNPNPHIGKAISSNPCQEFTSIPYNSCNLGSINLTKFVKDGKVDYGKLESKIRLAVRFLDNMITVNNLPIEKIDKVTKGLRSVGLGVMGFADLMYMLEIPYNSDDAIVFTNKLMSFIKEIGWDESKKLAKEKGVYSLYKNSEHDKNNMPVRNSNIFSIAPTGSISFIANVSSGIEPNFALAYKRRTFDETEYNVVNKIFKEKLESLGIYSEEIINKIIKNKGSCQGIREIPKDIQDIFVTAGDISPSQHLKVLGEIQKYVDLSISKTVNLPSSATTEDIENIFYDAWKLNIKGITVYRDGSREDQVLSTSDDKQKDMNIPEKLERGVIIQCSDDLIGKKRKLSTGCGSLHVNAYFDPINGELMEVFFSKGSTGGCLAYMNALSRQISSGLRSGQAFDVVIDQLNSISSCPSYIRRSALHNDTSKGSSCPNATGYALRDMQNEMFEELGIEKNYSYVKNVKQAEHQNNINKQAQVNNVCPDCGEKLITIEGCLSCVCGFSRCD